MVPIGEFARWWSCVIRRLVCRKTVRREKSRWSLVSTPSPSRASAIVAARIFVGSSSVSKIAKAMKRTEGTIRMKAYQLGFSASSPESSLTFQFGRTTNPAGFLCADTSPPALTCEILHRECICFKFILKQVRSAARSTLTNHITKECSMKLYYSPGACSLSPHIALLEAGIAQTSSRSIGANGERAPPP